MTHLQTVVTVSRAVADGYIEMAFEWPEFLSAPKPGQFFTLRPGRTTVPLLRRPFAFSGIDEFGAHFIFERRGQATEMLAGKRAGDPLDVLAPLGNFFPEPAPGVTSILVAGGIGVGPILYFANELAGQGARPLLVIGGRSTSKIPRVDQHSAVRLVVCTDDGSSGYCGTPTDYLEREVPEALASAVLYLCGPRGLLVAGHELAEQHDVRAWVSMEQTMGCAVGACMGCAVRVHGPQTYARVCTEGPVFDSRKIVWT